MRSPRDVLLNVSLVSVLTLSLIGYAAPSARAQVRGPVGFAGIGFVRGGAGFGVGPGWGLAPGLFWPGFFPNAYQGFYTNGFSLYGPPVPTDSPVPGVFGGTDQRFYGLGAYYAFPQPNFDPRQSVLFANVLRGPGGEARLQYVPAGPDHPMFGGRRVSVQRIGPNCGPAATSTVPTAAPPAAPLTVPIGPACADIVVRLPQADAQLSVDGQLTPTSGIVRVLQSPPLNGEQEYEYRIGAIWHEDSGSVSRERVVRIRAGSRVVVDFNRPVGE